MNFQEGDVVTNILRERDGVFVRLINETLAVVDYGDGPEPTSIEYLGLIEWQLMKEHNFLPIKWR